MPYSTLELPTPDEDYLAFDAKAAPYSEMTPSERLFLHEVAKLTNSSKPLEVGVAEGASSAIIVHALGGQTPLNSIDYSEPLYIDNNRKTGYAYGIILPNLPEKRNLYTGGVSAKFMDAIGDAIDFALLDTSHVHPGELLDFLMVYPYLKKDATIVLHDVNVSWVRLLGHDTDGKAETTCRVLFSTLPGEKLIPNTTEYEFFPNIGAVRLDGSASSRIDDIFSMLAIPWSYTPTEEDVGYAAEAFKRHYGSEYRSLFLKTVAMQKKMAEYAAELREIEHTFKIPKPLAKVACWFIPGHANRKRFREWHTRKG